MNIEQNLSNYEIPDEYWHLVQGGIAHPSTVEFEIQPSFISICALVEDAEKPGSGV